MLKSSFWQSSTYRIGRWIVLTVALIALLILAANVLASSRILSTDDFVQYWSVGRANLRRQNPYDPAVLARYQSVAGRNDYMPGVATIAWNPPWILPLLMPFGLLSYGAARLIWWLFSLSAIFLAATWAWSLFDGPEAKRWIAWVSAFGFVPTLLALRVGQLGPFLLVGVVGFVWAAHRKRLVIAGAWAAFLTVKPQLFVALFAGVLVWVLSRRAFLVAIGGLLALTAATLVASVANPNVLIHYWLAVSAYPPVDWATPTIGAVLRHLMGLENFWLQFIPPAVGLVWCTYYWRERRQTWSWVEGGPLLLLVSLVTAAYAWTYDLVLLTFPALYVIAMATRSRYGRRLGGLLVAYLGLSGAMVVQQLWVHNDYWFMWVAPTFLIWFSWAHRTVLCRKTSYP